MTSDTMNIQNLRHALRHLYEPAELSHSPLIDEFAIPAGGESASALRCILIDAIQSLKPQKHLPQTSKAWRIYKILAYRFVEQSTQKQVASELGFSIRQLYRLEVAALQTLSATLAAHTTRLRFAGTPDTNETSAYNDSAGAEHEFDLLKISPNEIIETIPFIESILQTTSPLSKSLGLRINFSQPARLPSIYGKLVPLRQGIINVLTAVAQKIPGGQITLELTPEEQFINLVLTAVPQMNEMNSSEDQLAESYHLALRLIELSGGSMKVVQQSAGQLGLTLQISLPLSGSHLVLAVDDNLDAFRLIERYLVDSPYRLEELQDPTQLIATAEALKPSAILLDVMLPGTDGWELLGRLREHPSLRQIPVIICTILPQESLALSLGATAFLRKPIKQERLLQTLDNLVSPREIRSS